MHIETIDIKGKTVSFTEIAGMVDFSESSCFGLRCLTSNVRSDNRRSEIIATGLLIKELFGYDCTLKHRPNGVPYLEGGGKQPQISISHCNDLVAVAYDDEPVGVDVEKINERVMRIRERVQGDEELRFSGHSVMVNTLVWTAKEALFKVIPEEGVDFAKDLLLDLHDVSEKLQVNEFTAEAFGRKYQLVSKLIDDRILTIAYQIK